ncbi:hypothetical protein [Persicitalea jodogahamensis]|uniref:Outer membrane lipoprotein-sorting protein n=1 Tax=Persicitalea jodogahamensis TaxID=402147 RepID=A0A8J3D500_9BACT|nr:hypothetical protein [Persicitalea jodogahamensis]GHB83949.1 hypothetical protein GCM10007390_43890 [Persicitalea jodogahamensis]
MKKHFLFLVLFIGGLTVSSNAQKSSNPAAKGFNTAGSDAKAIALADAAMDAMGGRKNWDNTHYITWNFFGNRRLTWDKWTGDVRVENLKNDQTVLLNVNTDKGRVMKNGQEITQPDSVDKYVKQAKSAWINDSYWLVMPYKLKDSGVTLKYMGEDKTEDGAAAEKIQMTFENVGDTPQNKYYVWLSPDSKMVTQWAYFAKAENDKPNFTMPWKAYKPYGKVMLSGDRGQRQLTDIQVFDKLPKSVFESFEKPTF